jgi:DNA-binding LacI/PurR family transcriptional regulator
LIGFDGLPSSESSVPALTTIRQPITQTGVRAVHLLNDLVNGVAAAPIVEILPVELVVRESCGAMRVPAATEVV